jgi:hypothetical protein
MAENRDQLWRVAAAMDGDPEAQTPADPLPDSAEARRVFTEQSHIDALLRMQAGELRPPADLSQRVNRTLWRRRVGRTALIGGLAASLCLAIAAGWLANRSRDTDTRAPAIAGQQLPVTGQETLSTLTDQEHNAVCNLLYIDPASRTVTIVFCRLPNGQDASAELRTFALAPDCRLMMDGRPVDLHSMTVGQQVVAYAVTDGAAAERLVSLTVKP